MRSSTENEQNIKISKGAKIRNRYNQVPHLTQDTNGKMTNPQQTPQSNYLSNCAQVSFFDKYDRFTLNVMQLTHAHIQGDLQFWHEWWSAACVFYYYFMYIFHLHGEEQLSTLASILNRVS